MSDEVKTILVLCAVIVAAFSITYLYLSANSFVDILKRPIKMISWGLFCIDAGVLLVTVISYEALQGVDLNLFGISLSVFFYALYVIGSVLVIAGARKFKHSPKAS